MNSSAPSTTSDYLARFITAVVPSDYYWIFDDTLYDEDDYMFNILLHEDTTLNFHPVDDAGNRGAIFYFDDVRIPQPVEDVNDLQVMFEPPFIDFMIMEPPGHHSLIVLYVDDDAPSITTPGNEELHLAHVEWRH